MLLHKNILGPLGILIHDIQLKSDILSQVFLESNPNKFD